MCQASHARICVVSSKDSPETADWWWIAGPQPSPHFSWLPSNAGCWHHPRAPPIITPATQPVTMYQVSRWHNIGISLALTLSLPPYHNKYYTFNFTKYEIKTIWYLKQNMYAISMSQHKYTLHSHLEMRNEEASEELYFIVKPRPKTQTP